MNKGYGIEVAEGRTTLIFEALELPMDALTHYLVRMLRELEDDERLKIEELPAVTAAATVRRGCLQHSGTEGELAPCGALPTAFSTNWCFS